MIGDSHDGRRLEQKTNKQTQKNKPKGGTVLPEGNVLNSVLWKTLFCKVTQVSEAEINEEHYTEAARKLGDKGLQL